VHFLNKGGGEGGYLGEDLDGEETVAEGLDHRRQRSLGERNEENRKSEGGRRKT
jgi:hypothetical protein